MLDLQLEFPVRIILLYERAAERNMKHLQDHIIRILDSKYIASPVQHIFPDQILNEMCIRDSLRADYDAGLF